MVISILTYQKIGTPPKNTPLPGEWTTLKQLTRTLDKIKKRGVATLSPRQLLEDKIPNKSVLLLFLDGYRSFYTDVYPLLKARDLSACVCLPTACLGGHNRWQNPYQESWQDLLSWDEIKTLAKDERISFGAQALNREDLSLIPPEQARYAAQESIFRLTENLPAAPQLVALFPTKKQIKIPAKIVPDFNGIMVTDKNGMLPNSSQSLKVIRGNSWRAFWAI